MGGPHRPGAGLEVTVSAEDAARALWADLKAGDAEQWVLGFRMSQGARKPVDEFVEAFVGDVEALLDQRGADPGQAESMARQIWAIAREEAQANRARRLTSGGEHERHV